MDEELKKKVLQHLTVYRTMTSTVITDRSINFAKRKVLKMNLKDLDSTILRFSEL